VQTERPPVATEIVLGTRHELGMSWVLPERARLRAARPWLGIHMYFSAGPDLLLRLRTHEIDCAVTSTRPTDPKLDALTLHREDYALVASPSLLGAVPLRRLADLAQHTLVDISAELPLWRYLEDAVPAGKLPVCRRASFLSCIAAMRDEVLRGDGIAVLPAYFVRADLAARRLRRVLPAVKLAHDYFRLVFRRGDARRPLFEAIAEDLRAAPLR
jgi:DNA-binding transcriptional LysR family regulator